MVSLKKYLFEYYREVEGSVVILAKNQEEAEERFSVGDYDNEQEEEKNIEIEEITEITE